MEDYIKIDTVETFDEWAELERSQYEYFDEESLDYLRSSIENNTLVIFLEVYDIDKEYWDSQLYIIYKEKPDAFDMVNNLLRLHPDELSMEDEVTLRVWWD